MMQVPLKRYAMSIAQSGVFRQGLALSEQLDRSTSRCLRVLTYHRVLPLDTKQLVSPRLQSATPAMFDRHMEFLATHYRVVSMAEVLDAWHSRGRLPSRAVLITFDDAYRDFADHAWPILKQYRLPATLFVPTALPDHPRRTFWWDRLHHALQETQHSRVFVDRLGHLPLGTSDERLLAYNRVARLMKSLQHTTAMAIVEDVCLDLEVAAADNREVLGWNALRRLQSEGVTLGAHTRTHPRLDRIPLAAIRHEVRRSLFDLQRHAGTDAHMFAYPGGAYNRATIDVLRECGVALAFTTQYGLNHLDTTDPLRLCRIHVGLATSLEVLRAKLLSWVPVLCSVGR